MTKQEHKDEAREAAWQKHSDDPRNYFLSSQDRFNAGYNAAHADQSRGAGGCEAEFICELCGEDHEFMGDCQPPVYTRQVHGADGTCETGDCGPQPRFKPTDPFDECEKCHHEAHSMECREVIGYANDRDYCQCMNLTLPTDPTAAEPAGDLVVPDDLITAAREFERLNYPIYPREIAQFAAQHAAAQVKGAVEGERKRVVDVLGDILVHAHSFEGLSNGIAEYIRQLDTEAE